MTTCTSTFITTTTKMFWMHAEHMHISQRTGDGFKLKGINDPEDLFELSAEGLYTLFESMKNPVGFFNYKGDYMAAHPTHISSKSKKRTIVAANATRYYTQVGRSITPANMSWRTFSNFDMQWQALLKQEKQDDPEVPKLGGNGSILKWIESFKLHTKSIIVVRMFSLSYALDNEASKATEWTDLISHQPHLADYGSITTELAALTSHYHPLYAQDNGNVYNRIEISLTGTSHSSSIIRFRCTPDGKGAMDALVS